jgi:hypothetical protein
VVEAFIRRHDAADDAPVAVLPEPSAKVVVGAEFA